MSILFITRNRIGDALLTTGLLAGLSDRFPDHGFTIVCGPETAALFAKFPALERLIPLAKGRFHLHWARLWPSLAGRRWEAVVDLRRTAIGHLLPARRRFRPGRNPGAQSEAAHLSRALGFAQMQWPRLWPDPLAEAEAARLLPADRPTLALGIGARWPGKRWPVECFALLARSLVRDHGAPLPGARVLLVGGAEDAGLGRVFAGFLDGEIAVSNMIGRADLALSAALLGRATLFVGNDSAPMHLAAAAGTPTLGLFGPTDETVYGPAGPLCGTIRGPFGLAEIQGRPGFDRAGTACHMLDLAPAAAVAAATRLLSRARERLPGRAP